MTLYFARAQNVVINELVPANTILQDDFEVTSDWIELFNPTVDTLSLEGYRLSDTPEDSTAWTFGDVSLAPGSHLLVFASGRNIPANLSYETIIEQGDLWKYLIPDDNLAGDWRMPGFDDSNWETGPSGFGYGDGDDNTMLSFGTRSVYIRKSFSLDNIDQIASVLLHIDYDDAFIAYINGEEIARANIGAPGEETGFDAEPFTDHEAIMYSGEYPDFFDVSTAVDLLEEGENILAIQHYNISSSSSDLTVIPYLTLGRRDGSNQSLSPDIPVPENRIHADFKLSADGEEVYLFDPGGTLQDSTAFPSIPDNYSYGRLEDGAGDWVLFSSPTPEQINDGPYYTGINLDTIGFSHPSGIYEDSILLILTGSDSIRFTLDGSEPDAFSTLYTEPLVIEENTILKARIFDSNLLGNRFSNTYLIDAEHDLPVIDLNTRPEYLWDPEIGMYVLGNNYQNSFPFFGANFWEDWEYPFDLRYFDTDGSLVYETRCGAKIFGGWSRGLDQRSFSLFAREEYGDDAFHYKFFENRPYDKFESLVLRNSGNDWESSMMRDGVMTSLMEGSRVDYQAHRPVVVYLNGEYWGVYNLREKINEHFLASLHDVDPGDVDLLEDEGKLKHGSAQEYNELRDFIEGNSMVDPENFAWVTDRIDEIGFIQYQVAQIYYDNRDWPGNNIRYWKSGHRKWRWILFDTDFGLSIWDPQAYKSNTLTFATAANGPDWPNPPWSTLFLRRFLENESFRKKFVNYFADAMNSIFLPSFAIERVNDMADVINEEMYTHRPRWGQSVYHWQESVNDMRTFFDERPDFMRHYIKQYFGLPSVREINIQNVHAEQGIVRVNSLVIEEESWSGLYFQGNPVPITAFAKPGYHFSYWSGDINSTEPMIWVDPSSETHLIAHFETAEPPENPVVINEINYNSPEIPDPSDWIELYNPMETALDLSGWIFRDDNDEHAFIFPEETMVESKGYLVVCRNTSSFQNVFPEINNFIGDFDFGLSSEGDAVRIYDPTESLIDAVYFSQEEPWPAEANGNGPTLELISPERDNVLPSNWHAFKGNGTPGAQNHYIIGLPEKQNDIGIQLFPNPVTNQITVSVQGSHSNFTMIRIYDLQGRLLKSREMHGPVQKTRMNISDLPAGNLVFVVGLSSGEYQRTIILKK